eukprot:CAMPEP_0115240828 /NCGR_PEP_ID=MMETSP0270-20121206/38114_1 /TAXON_ID=71861 /ORGANISM="Scrippsiella trochoidea, Strain CCMP3099" /LENGTH=156 /DNA_ID=CAMNT_0002655827 /DNA_START=82 /DNA_END=552 /DNA_ORIENTATION=+
MATCLTLPTASMPLLIVMLPLLLLLSEPQEGAAAEQSIVMPVATESLDSAGSGCSGANVIAAAAVAPARPGMMREEQRREEKEAEEEDEGDGGEATVQMLLAEEMLAVGPRPPREEGHAPPGAPANSIEPGMAGLPLLGVLAWALLPRQSVATWAF